MPFTAVEVTDLTAQAPVTLFTSAGGWDLLRCEYSHRRLVVARPAVAG